VESFDVVVVGARLAGCAVAAPLARAGRRVLVLDRMPFPSDQLSTHVLLPAGTSELASMGALPRILALRPSLVRYVHVEVEGAVCRERLRPAADGIDYGVCVPRDLQDVELVAAVREQGADVRERCTVTGLRWRAGRVAGVRYRDGDGREREVVSALVVGADGRRSTVASLVGAWVPYRLSRNGRGLVFRYLDDPRAGTADAETYFQWREGESFAFAFPTTPAGRLLALLMGHRDEVAAARREPDAYWARKLDEHPGLAARVSGAQEGSKLRSTAETPAFFRASSGPGWALAGDAGHFKDPVTGQGMRDAMFAGRTLAQEVLPFLHDAAALDRATRRWEAARDRECLPAYHFANADTHVARPSPLLRELVRGAGRDEEPDIGDVFGRGRTPQEIVPPARAARTLLGALMRERGRRREALARGLGEARTALAIQREAGAGAFRSARAIPGSEKPGAPWPDPPRAEAAPAGSPRTGAADAAPPAGAPADGTAGNGAAPPGEAPRVETPPGEPRRRALAGGGGA
jgi:flavin-dependent dehydrogenase